MNTTERIYNVMFCAESHWFSASELSKILNEDIRFVRNALAKENSSGDMITREMAKIDPHVRGKRGFEYRLSPSNRAKKMTDFWVEKGFEGKLNLSQKVFGDFSITYLENAGKELSLFLFEDKSTVYIIPPEHREYPLFSYFFETITEAYISEEGESEKGFYHKDSSLSSEKLSTALKLINTYTRVYAYINKKKEKESKFEAGRLFPASKFTPSLSEVFFELLSFDGVSDFFLELLSPEFREKVNSLSDGKRKTLSEALLKAASVFRDLPSSDGGSALSPSSEGGTPTAPPSGDSVPSSEEGEVDPALLASREAKKAFKRKKTMDAMARLEAEAEKNLHPRYWDFRKMPMKRDYEFARAYVTLIEWCYAEFSVRARKMHPSINKFKDSKNWKYFHKGRCLADEAGMRYEDFIDGVFEYWGQQKRPPKATKYPTPNTCFGEEFGLTGAICFQCSAFKNSVTITLDDFDYSLTLDERLRPTLFDPATMDEAIYNQALILYEDRIFSELERVAFGGQFGLLDLVSASIDYGILPQTWAEGYGLHHNLKALEKYRFTPPPAHFNYETLFQIVKQPKRF